MEHVNLMLIILILSMLISPAAANTIHPTYISAYGEDFHNDVFSVHTNDTSKKHNLKTIVFFYGKIRGEVRIFPIGPCNVYFECWEKPDQDNNCNGVCGELLYTESDRAFFDIENEVNPAKWYKHGVLTGEYDIKIKFKGSIEHWLIRENRLYSASSITVPFQILP